MKKVLTYGKKVIANEKKRKEFKNYENEVKQASLSGCSTTFEKKINIISVPIWTKNFV